MKIYARFSHKVIPFAEYKKMKSILFAMSALEEKKEIGRASVVLGVFTFLSRVLGLVRNQILSHFFGASFLADAFIAAFTIPNALRRLFGEGALTPSIVATLTRHVNDDPQGKTWRAFLTSAFVWLTIFLTLIASLGIYFAPQLTSLYVPQFSEIPNKMELTVKLTRLLFIFILFIGWSAFFMGVLNTFRSFGISAFVPALNSLCVILIVPLGIFFFHPPDETGIFLYGCAMLVGALAQAIFQIPALKRVKVLPVPDFKLKDPRVLELGKLLVPSFFSMAVYQMNIIINRSFASQIDGGVSHLFYADLIIELPVALIATSIGTAVIPSFSRLITNKENEELMNTLHFSLKSVWTLALPCCGALLILAAPIVSTLYFSGRFTSEDLSETSHALIAYACGLPFFAILRIFLAYFFSEKNTWIPFWAGIAALVVNALIAWSLAPRLGVFGIALATSISSATNLFILVGAFILRNGFWHFKKIGKHFVQVLIATGLMVGAIQLALQLFSKEMWLLSGITFQKIYSLAALIALGVVSFGVFSLCFGGKKSEILRNVLKISIKS